AGGREKMYKAPAARRPATVANGAPAAIVVADAPTENPSWSNPAPSGAVSFAVSVASCQPARGSSKTYTAPCALFAPTVAPTAPAAMVEPEMATEKPKKSPGAPSDAV